MLVLRQERPAPGARLGHPQARLPGLPGPAAHRALGAVAALLAALLLASPARAADEEEVEASTATVSFESVSAGLKGNWTRESNWRGWDLGPVLSAAALVQPSGGARWQWRYEAEVSYDDDLSKLSSEATQQSTRVQTLELKYAKVSALKVAGADLKERLRFVPYLYAGVQSVRSRTDTDGEVAFDRYWSPTWGAGVEFSLSKKTRLSLDWEQNTEGGGRRITRLYLELKFAVVGDPDES